MSDFTDMEKGDIVQIVDKKHAWYPAILIVDEVKNWGVQAWALIPGSNDGSEPVGKAYNRLPFNVIQLVGTANIIPE